MNTPAHIVLGMTALARRGQPKRMAPLAIGSVLPDAPMFVFFAVERFWRGRDQAWIWSQGYFSDHWQDFFDVFNSLPLIAVAFLVAWRQRAEWAMALLLAMALHCFADLLVHHDDAHRHFFPFLDWRFESPVSYWDPAHYGLQFAALEFAFAVFGCVHLWRTHSLRWVRVLSATLLVLTVFGALVSVVLWRRGGFA